MNRPSPSLAATLSHPMGEGLGVRALHHGGSWAHHACPGTCSLPRKSFTPLELLSLALVWMSIQVAFAADTNPAALTVRGEVDQPLQLSLTDLQAMPRTTAKARDKNGDEVAFEGVTLSEVIKRAKPRFTEKCCGNAANTCVIVRAADRYRAVFSLAEIDPDFTDRKVVLAFRRNGKPLAEAEGPVRLVVPEEKVHTRWVRQVASVEIVRAGEDVKP